MPALALATDSDQDHDRILAALFTAECAANDPPPDRIPATPRPGKARPNGRDLAVVEGRDLGDSSHANPTPAALYLTPQEAAQALSVSPGTLAQWRSKGTGPVYRLIGRRVAYPREAVAAYGAEIRGGYVRKRPKMQVKARVHSSGQIQLDMLFPPPMKRQRPFAPKGLDMAAAIAWGEKEADKRWRAYMKDAATVKPVDSEETTTKHKLAAKRGVPTIGEYWPTFEGEYVSTLKPSSHRHYANVWILHLRSIVQDIPLDRCDREVFARIKTACRAKGHSPASLNAIVSKLRRCLVHAEENGKIAAESIPRIKVEKIPERHVDIYSRNDLRELIATAKDHDMLAGLNSGRGKLRGSEGHVLACLLVYAGLRIGEAAGLYWSDCDFAAGTVTIQRNMCKGIQQASPKGEIGTLTMHPALAAALLAWREVCPRESRRVLSYTDRSAGEQVCRWQEWSRLPVYGAHRIRHSVLTHMVESGLDVHALQNFARHSKIETTMRYYAHANKVRATARAVATMDYSEPVNPDAASNDMVIVDSPPELLH